MNRQQRRAAERQGKPVNGVNPAAVDPLFAQAMQLQQAGRLAEAEQLHRQVLARDPRHADSLHMLGVLNLQAGRPQPAAELITRAIAVEPRAAPFHNNLGSALRALGQFAEAEASFRQALALRPDYVRALINLGQTLSARDPREAAAVFRRALALGPGDVEANWGLGVLAHQAGGLAEAAECYLRVLRAAPDAAEIHINLAYLRAQQGRTSEAIEGLQRALRLQPDAFEVWGRLGDLLQGEARLTEAADAFRNAARGPAAAADAHNGLGNVLANLGDLEGAVAAYRRSVALNPDLLDARSNLIMTLHSQTAVTAQEILTEARAYAARVEPRPAPAFANPRDPDRPLRVGYVSADFRVHPVGFFLERVLAAHDRASVEAILYSDTSHPDGQTARLRAHAAWRPILGQSAEEAARTIRADGIDVLVDLAGHTGSNRLPVFAARAAPVQASWLGYFGTTGLSAMDYVVADDVVVPPGEEPLFSEAVERLPGPYLCWTPPSEAVSAAGFPALAGAPVTFGCFNNRAKITPETIAAWAAILEQTPGSRLFLKSWSFADAGCRESLIRAFAGHGVDADRLLFEGLSPRAEALAAYNRVDIALDPFPFGGCTTTADTLWMGVPLVALAGGRWSGRMSRSILAAVGLDDWVAPDVADYVARAVAMAGDLAALSALRADLRERLEASTFCDGPGFTRELEAAYRRMWRRWVAGALG
jgi:predicted O-linked N-acetylglucosamine transferase (SPINDLY family)